MRITSAKIVVNEDAEGNRTYVATGSPVTYRQKRDNVDDYMEGFAERAVFDDRSDILKLYNRAMLRSSQGELTGDFVSYDRAKEFVEVTGAPPGAPATGARVKATIVPQKKGADGKPLPRPQAPALTLKPDTGAEANEPK
jgi:lipopolysaccharide export system protein LptA